MIPLPYQLAPSFDASDHDGKRHTLADYKGKWLLLYFYPKDDTPGCTKEACGFRDLYQELNDAEVSILGVSADPIESHKNFAEKYALPFPLLADIEKKIIRTYNATPEFFGKRVSFLIHPEGHIDHLFQKIDCEHHAEEVLTYIRKKS